MRLNNLNLLGEMIVYHGSDAGFDKFDPERVGTESGADKGGWGFYFSDNEEVAQNYISGRGTVKQYEIPNGPYLPLDDGVDLGFLQKILDELKDLEIDEDELEEFHKDFMDDESYMANTSIDDIYTWLGYVLGSRRDASSFFSDLGYVGSTFSDKVTRDATNYVVYDENDIRER